MYDNIEAKLNTHHTQPIVYLLERVHDMLPLELSETRGTGPGSRETEICTAAVRFQVARCCREHTPPSMKTSPLMISCVCHHAHHLLHPALIYPSLGRQMNPDRIMDPLLYHPTTRNRVEVGWNHAPSLHSLDYALQEQQQRANGLFL